MIGYMAEDERQAVRMRVGKMPIGWLSIGEYVDRLEARHNVTDIPTLRTPFKFRLTLK